MRDVIEVVGPGEKDEEPAVEAAEVTEADPSDDELERERVVGKFQD